jgi:DNA-binding GntR family transcriptional regulator
MDPSTLASRRRFRMVRHRASIAIGRVSTLEALVRTLRRQILEGTIPVGAHLAEVDLAEMHGVSRQSMRSALAELVHLGLLERAPHRGVWVRTLSVGQLRDLWWVRTILEREAVRRAMAGATDWSGARAAARAIADLTPQSSWADAVEADLAFHHAVVAAAASPHMTRLHALLMSELTLSLAGNLNNEAPGFMGDEHARLVDSFDHGDPDAAVALLEQHLQEGLDIGTRVRLIGEPTMIQEQEEEPG